MLALLRTLTSKPMRRLVGVYKNAFSLGDRGVLLHRNTHRLRRSHACRCTRHGGGRRLLASVHERAGLPPLEACACGSGAGGKAPRGQAT